MGNRLAFANGDRFEYNDRNDVAAREGWGGKTSYHYDSRDLLTAARPQRASGRPATTPWPARGSDKLIGHVARRILLGHGTVAAELNETGRLQGLRLCRCRLPWSRCCSWTMIYPRRPGFGPPVFPVSVPDRCPRPGEDDRGQNLCPARPPGPYGTAHVDPSSTIDLALRFPGHYLDAETGLYCNRFRYYSPDLLPPSRTPWGSPWG